MLVCFWLNNEYLLYLIYLNKKWFFFLFSLLFNKDSSVTQYLDGLEAIFDQFWSLPHTDSSDSLFTNIETSILEPISVPDEPNVAPNFKKFYLFFVVYIYLYVFFNIFKRWNTW